MAKIGIHNEFKKIKGFNRYKYLMLSEIKNTKTAMNLIDNNKNAKILNNFIFVGAKLMLRHIPLYNNTKISNNKTR
jgi:hypothetical protein